MNMPSQTAIIDTRIDSNSKTYSRSTLVSRNIVVEGHRTSVRLEPEMWQALRDICQREHNNLHQICTNVAAQKNQDTSLTAAIRVFVMSYFRAAATEEGHSKAGHGRGVMLRLHVPMNSAYTLPPKSILTKTSYL